MRNSGLSPYHFSPYLNQEVLFFPSSSSSAFLHCHHLTLSMTPPCFGQKPSGKVNSIIYNFTDYAKALDCVDHNKLWKILQDTGILDHLACLLRNLYAGQEATVRTGHGTTNWLQIGKGVHQGCILSHCLFNYRQSTSRETLGWKKHKLRFIKGGSVLR